MGMGIANSAARGGFKVSIRDIDPGAVVREILDAVPVEGRLVPVDPALPRRG